jgi:hypothetical protein
MRELRVLNRTRGTVLGDRVALADRWWQRMRGLLGRPPIARGEGMLLSPCSAVHMRGMRYPLDVAILARDGRVVAVYLSLPPGGRTAWRHRGGHATLELPVGTLGSTGTLPGDVIDWSPAPPTPPGSPHA